MDLTSLALVTKDWKPVYHVDSYKAGINVFSVYSSVRTIQKFYWMTEKLINSIINSGPHNTRSIERVLIKPYEN